MLFRARLVATVLLIGSAVVGATACANSPTAPAPPQAVVVPPPAAPLKQPSFRYGAGQTLCQTGYCASFTMALTNDGPGCATNVHVTVSWYGSDGAVLLPNTPTITMGAPGGLSTYLFRPGTTVGLTSLGGFNDVRSAHTVYDAAGTWTTVAC